MRSDYLEMVIPLGCFSILDWMRLFYPFWINGNGLSVGFLFWVAYLWLMDQYAIEYFVMVLKFSSCDYSQHHDVVIGMLLIMFREYYTYACV